MKFVKRLILPVLLAFISCQEKLPDRIVPRLCLKVTTAQATQGGDAGGQLVTFLIIAENVYDETLQNSVDVNGAIHVWWGKKPWIEANVELSNIDIMSPPTKLNGRELTVDPGGTVVLRKVWYLFTDDDEYIPDMLDYSQNTATGEQIFALPEEFVFDAVITIFNQTGLLYVEPVTFTYKGWKKTEL